MLESPLRWEEKRDALLLNVFNKIPENEVECLKAVLDFYFCGESIKNDEPSPKERLIDWKKDALRIKGDFRVYTGIDLSKERMHWWDFMAIFNSLPPDSQMMTVIRYRGMDLSEIQDAKERERYARIKRAVSLDPIDYEVEYDSAMDWGDMNASHNL